MDKNLAAIVLSIFMEFVIVSRCLADKKLETNLKPEMVNKNQYNGLNYNINHNSNNDIFPNGGFQDKDYELTNLDKRHLSSLLANRNAARKTNPIKRHFSSILKCRTGICKYEPFTDDNDDNSDSNLSLVYPADKSILNLEYDKRLIGTSDYFPKRFFSTLLRGDEYDRIQNDKRHMSSIFENKRHLSSLFNDGENFRNEIKRHIGSLISAYQNKLGKRISSLPLQKYKTFGVNDDNSNVGNDDLINSKNVHGPFDDSHRENINESDKRHYSSILKNRDTMKRHISSILKQNELYKRNENLFYIPQKSSDNFFPTEIFSEIEKYNFDTSRNHISDKNNRFVTSFIKPDENDDKLKEILNNYYDIKDKLLKTNKNVGILTDFSHEHINKRQAKNFPNQNQEKDDFSKEITKNPTFGKSGKILKPNPNFKETSTENNKQNAALVRKKRYVGSLARNSDFPFRYSRNIAYVDAPEKPRQIKSIRPVITYRTEENVIDPEQTNLYESSLEDVGYFPPYQKRFLGSLARQMWFPRRYRSFVDSDVVNRENSLPRGDSAIHYNREETNPARYENYRSNGYYAPTSYFG